MMLANPEGKDMEHFEEQAYSLIIALILHNRYKSAHTGLMACLADVGATLKEAAPSASAEEKDSKEAVR